MTAKSKVQPPPDATIAAAKRLSELVPVRQSAAIVSVIPRDPDASARARDLAGEYRVVTPVVVGIPRDQRLNSDGTLNEYLPVQVYALPGDTVWVDSIDASFMLDNGVVEPLDARPSAVGKPSAMELATAQRRPWDFATVKAMREAKAAGKNA